MVRRIVVASLLLAGCSSVQDPPHDSGALIGRECGGVWQPSVPVEVWYGDTDPTWASALSDAIRWWGPRWFEQVENQSGTSIDVVTSTETPDRATTQILYDRRTCRALYTRILFPPDPGRYPVLVAAHELGHVLGLDHDDDPRSVMFPSVSESAIARGFRLFETDRARLEKHYQERAPRGANRRDDGQ